MGGEISVFDKQLTEANIPFCITLKIHMDASHSCTFSSLSYFETDLQMLSHQLMFDGKSHFLCFSAAFSDQHS